jgi:hypothetical protein
MDKNNVIYSAERFLREQKEFLLHGTINVYVNDPLPENVSIRSVISKVENTIPVELVQGVEAIIVGHFEEFDKREVNAAYDSGTIYVTNDQDDVGDMFDDIVHEIAHSIEPWAGQEIYADGTLVGEFRGKREKYFNLLKQLGHEDLDRQQFLDVEYSQDFDNVLYKDVGYEKLDTLSVGILPSSYALTSIKEYWASGFEEYFMGSRKELKDLCPVLNTKIENVILNTGLEV